MALLVFSAKRNGLHICGNAMFWVVVKPVQFQGVQLGVVWGKSDLEFCSTCFVRKMMRTWSNNVMEPRLWLEIQLDFDDKWMIYILREHC
jgi:hypothetical protein